VRLILLFVILPLVELMILLKLAEWITGLWTFALVVVTGIIGASLARRQGWSVLRRIQAETQQGQMPTTSLVDALMIFVAGALLITPGILTDVFGFSLLVPACRALYRARLITWFRQRVQVQSFTSTGQFTGEEPFSRSEVIDSYVVEDKTDHETDASQE
jgi:UPF0716 protein FxsA